MQVNLDSGYGLVPLVDERRGAPLMGRITGVRRQLSKELGFVVSQVRVRDDINMQPYAYRVVVGGVVVAEDSVSPDEMLALDTGQAVGQLSGKQAKDPTRSEEHTSELQSLMRISYAVFCLKQKKLYTKITNNVIIK